MSLFFTVKRVFGGGFARRGEVPHIVSLQHRNGTKTEHFCGATIIHPLLLLPAASCFEGEWPRPANMLAIAGKHRRLVPDPATQRIRGVAHVFVHKKYNDTNWNDDIAILVLNQSLTINDFVRLVPVRHPAWQLPGLTI